ncbi:MAG TPA: CHAD domain-containing protein [Candidatus Sulfotelmatobacter sp.]|nr:CHAD domain-containing protein [Candidatus Sulfotelmatobacter sp.]
MEMAKDPIQSVFQRLERDLVKVCSRQNAESVHRFRTAARRLQTMLEELFPAEERRDRKLLKAVSRIRKRAGKVRDVDVQLAALRSLKIPQEPRRKSQLMNSLIELRAEHEKKLRKALSQQAVREIRKRLKRAAKDLRAATAGDALAVARKMLGQVPHADARTALTEDTLHHYRIVGKRARYVAELAPRSTEATEFITQLKRLQDTAGDWHDWLTLTHTVAKRLGDVHESSLVAALHNVTGAKFRSAAIALSVLRAAEAPKPASLTRRAAQGQPRRTKQSDSATAA